MINMVTRFEKERRKKILKWLIHGKVLDMGSIGHGELKPTLHHFLKDIDVGEVIGLDIKNGKDVDIVLDLNKKEYPIKSDSYDTIIAGEIIEHLDLPFNFLKECKRILKPNGRLIVTTPNMTSICYILGIVKNDERFINHSHSWNMLLFDELLKRTDFKVIHKELFNNLASRDYLLDWFTKIFPVFKTGLFYVLEKSGKKLVREVM